MKIYVSSIMTVPGQTDEYTISDHINAIYEHCGEGLIDYCIYDTGEVIPEFIKKYNKEGADLVEQDIDVAKNKFKKIKFLKRNLSVINGEYVRHDSGLVASSIIELICDDLRYQDKQNDPEYLMMNTKLKADKEINRKKRATAKASKRNNNKDKTKTKGKSKFSNKYSERIASIRESDNLASRKKRQAKKKTSTKRHSEKNEGTVRNRLIPDDTIENNTKIKNTSHNSKRRKTREDLKAEMERTLKNSKLSK